MYIIGSVVSFLNFVNSRLMSKRVFHGEKELGWTLIIEFRSTSYSLTYLDKSFICWFAGLSGFLAMFAAYNRDFSILLRSGGGSKARFRMLSIGLERKAPKASLILELMGVSIVFRWFGLAD